MPRNLTTLTLGLAVLACSTSLAQVTGGTLRVNNSHMD